MSNPETDSQAPQQDAEKPSGGRGTSSSPQIDIQQLTERVYRLMLADLRLERARGQYPGVRRKR